MKSHLPWYVAPTTACWVCKNQEGSACFNLVKHIHNYDHECGAGFDGTNLVSWCYLMNGLFHSLAFHLGLESLEQLLQFVVHNELFPPYVQNVSPFNSLERDLMIKYDQICNTGNASLQYDLDPPNSIIVLMHWRILANLLKLLDVDTQKLVKACEVHMLQNGFVVNSPTFQEENSSFPLIDTHFHLDQLLKRSGLHTLSALETKIGYSRSVYLEHCVANFVFPKAWPSFHYLAVCDPRVSVSVGVHPHFIEESQIKSHVSEVRRLLSHPKCVGLGEVGLDYTTNCTCYPRCKDEKSCRLERVRAQMMFLYEVLPLAKEFEKTIILHCRDSGTGEAARDTLTCLSDLGLTNHPIHRHCFSGDIKEMKEWIRVCPQVCFGFTTTLLKSDVVKEAVSKLELGRILLESDAPYLPPPNISTPINSPWYAIETAKEIAKQKNLPLSLTMCKLNENAHALYQFN